MTLFLTKNLYFTTKNSFISPFLVTSYFSRASLNTTSPNIGGTNAWAVPHLKFWRGPVSLPQPPRSPPMTNRMGCDIIRFHGDQVLLSSTYNAYGNRWKSSCLLNNRTRVPLCWRNQLDYFGNNRHVAKRVQYKTSRPRSNTLCSLPQRTSIWTSNLSVLTRSTLAHLRLAACGNWTTRSELR